MNIYIKETCEKMDRKIQYLYGFIFTKIFCIKTRKKSVSEILDK